MFYAISEKEINHHNVSWQAINHFYYKKNNQSIQDLLELIRSKKNYDILISSENFENLRFNKKFSNFINKIKKTHNLIIIWCVREQFSYLISLLNMLINKGGYIKNFDDLINQILKNGKLNFKPYIFWFDYTEQLKKIRKIFKIDKNKIKLILYSKQSNLFYEFCNILNIKIKVSPNYYKINESKNFFLSNKNLKNWVKSNLFIKKKFFNKNITKKDSIFFLIDKKKRINFNKKEILNFKNKIIKNYKNNNLKLFKTFKIPRNKINNFYDEY